MRVIRFLTACCLVSWTTRGTTIESGGPSDEICSCRSLECILNPNAGKYMTTFEEMRQIVIRVDAFNSSATDDLRPYISGKPRRDDVCSLGSLQLISGLSDGENSRLFLANVLVPQTGKRQRYSKDEDEEDDDEKADDDESIDRQVVVKYATDCLNRLQKRRGHPLVQEFTMLSLLNTTDISPKVYYLSPTAELSGPPDSTRSIGRFVKDHMDKCIEQRSHVRFLVQERVGYNLGEYMAYLAAREKDFYTSAAFTKQLIRIARRVLRQLEKLHSLGIVHGDIHSGNIAFREIGKTDKKGSDDVVLIDFEYASFFPSKFGKSGTQVSRIPSLSLVPLSYWQMAGRPAGPRDDVYRLVLTLADTLSRGRHFSGVRELVRRNVAAFGNPKRGTAEYVTINENVVAHVRVNEPWFNRSIALASAAIIAGDGSVPRDTLKEVIGILEKVEAYVKSGLECSYTRVDYAHIDSLLGQAADLI